MNLTGNTILITGGGSGIGRAMAEAFHARGNAVIIAGRTQEKLDAVTAANPGMESMTLDIADAASIEAFAAALTAKHPALNVVVHMAGVMQNEYLQTALLHKSSLVVADAAEVVFLVDLLHKCCIV